MACVQQSMHKGIINIALSKVVEDPKLIELSWISVVAKFYGCVFHFSFIARYSANSLEVLNTTFEDM